MCSGKIPFNCLVGAIDRINLWPSIDIEWIGQSYTYRITSRNGVGGEGGRYKTGSMTIYYSSRHTKEICIEYRIIQMWTFAFMDNTWERFWLATDLRPVRTFWKIFVPVFASFSNVAITRRTHTSMRAMVGSLWAANHRGRFDPLVQDHEPDPVIGGKGNPLSTIAEPQSSRFMHVNSSGRDVVSGRFRGRVTS